MLARTVLRAATKPTLFSHTLRAASTFSASAVEAMNPHGIEISKAQRVAKDGFVSGTPPIKLASLVLLWTLTDRQHLSNRQHSSHQIKTAL